MWALLVMAWGSDTKRQGWQRRWHSPSAHSQLPVRIMHVSQQGEASQAGGTHGGARMREARVRPPLASAASGPAAGPPRRRSPSTSCRSAASARSFAASWRPYSTSASTALPSRPCRSKCVHSC